MRGIGPITGEPGKGFTAALRKFLSELKHFALVCPEKLSKAICDY